MAIPKSKSWKSVLERIGSEVGCGKRATVSSIENAEKALGSKIPPELRELLLELNGLTDEFGAHVVWPAEQILSQNKEYRNTKSFRDLYMPFDHLLFFGEDGGGDLFAYAIHADGKIHKNDIFKWSHEDDGRVWFAGHLEQYMEKRLTDSDD